MSLAQSTFLSSPLKYSFTKYPHHTKVPFSSENNKLKYSRKCGKLGVEINGRYTYSTSPHHPLHELELPLPVDCGGNGCGIGIEKFYKGKNIFITGATGLLGKVLVEKLLRSTSVDKIYILVKASDKEAALDRLTKEARICLNVYAKSTGAHTKSTFVRTKLIPVVGNICEPNIGMDALSAHTIMEEVDVIIQSAASTTLNDRYDVLLDVNINAPQRLMRFAKRCNNLKLFVQISTAYVNGQREGVIYEEPLIMGETGRNNNEETLYPLDLSHEMRLAMKQCITSTNFDANKDLKRLGIQRAEYYGWYNTYTMSKALGEMVLNEIREDVALLIVRPSIIESTYNDPFPGWILGNRMFDPVIISYGKGHLPSFLANPDVILDIIPVDMVANTIIAAIAKHGNLNKQQIGVNVYNASSSVLNPLSFGDAFEYLYDYFKLAPLAESQTINKMNFFDNFNDFSKSIREEIFQCKQYQSNGEDEKKTQKIQDQCNAIATYAEQMCKIYEFAGFFNARFDSSNTLNLIEEMSKEEQLNFELDARNIDWKKYFQEIHVPGLRKYIINRNVKASVL